jgi:hypothetical protein
MEHHSAGLRDQALESYALESFTTRCLATNVECAGEQLGSRAQRIVDAFGVNKPTSLTQVGINH